MRERCGAAEAELAAHRALELVQVSNDPTTHSMAHEPQGLIYYQAMHTYRTLSNEAAMATVRTHVGMVYGQLA